MCKLLGVWFILSYRGWAIDIKFVNYAIIKNLSDNQILYQFSNVAYHRYKPEIISAIDFSFIYW